MFKDIAFFTLAEPGAMGVGNLMEFITAEGEKFSLFFSEEMPYSKVKEYNPAELSSCSTSVRTKGTSSTQSLRKIIRTCMKVLEITYVYVKIIILWSSRS